MSFLTLPHPFPPLPPRCLSAISCFRFASSTSKILHPSPLASPPLRPPSTRCLSKKKGCSRFQRVRRVGSPPLPQPRAAPATARAVSFFPPAITDAFAPLFRLPSHPVCLLPVPGPRAPLDAQRRAFRPSRGVRALFSLPPFSPFAS